MATTRYPQSNEMRRQVGSPRPKTRDSKDTLCRNVVIYGECRYEDKGCTFHHPPKKNQNSPGKTEATSRKAFSADSPSFTPSALQQPNNTKKSTFSSQAANAAPFTPKGANATPNMAPNAEASSIFNPAVAKEFTPQSYDIGTPNSTTTVPSQGTTSTYTDPFATMNSMGQTLSNATTPFNPYAAAEHDVIAGAGATYFQQPAAFSASLQPLHYHLYAPSGPQRSDLSTWQKQAYDFFMPETLREELQKKTHATLQVLPNSSLPQVERWHSLVPIDTTNSPKATSFGYHSYIYKTQNSRNGNFYAMRRLAAYTLTNVNAILETLHKWRKISSASIVRVHEIFTTQAFGDTSLIFVFDYHPLSKTLLEQYFPGTKHDRKSNQIREDTLWTYICQIASALKAIHSNGLAARCIEPSKVILTGKNRVRLAACAINDVLSFGDGQSQQKQQEDFYKLGTLILSIANSILPVHINAATSLSSLAASGRFTRDLREVIEWLVTPAPAGQKKTIEELLVKIAPHAIDTMDQALQQDDNLYSNLSREVENGRVARLMMKMVTVMNDSDHGQAPKWSPWGELYPLKLFRNHVFGTTDADGVPTVPKMGHILTCLNKLDVGTEELVQLASRDEEDLFIISYRELKQLFDRAFNEVGTRSKDGQSLYGR